MTVGDEGLPPRHPNALMNEQRRPTRIREWKHAPWLAVLAVCLGALMSQLNASIVTLAYPTLEHEFSVSLGAVTWVGLAYMLTIVSTLVIFGRVSDMVGRKLIYVYGLIVFIVGSLLCGTASSLTVLIASRVLQAVGGAMLQANSVAIVFLAAPRSSRAKALGFQAAAQALGLAVGPTLGGVLLGFLSWRWLFLVDVPVGLIALPAAIAFIPRSRHLAEREPLDWTGALLMVVAVSTLLGALSFGKTLGWSSPEILAGFSLCVLAGTALVVHERRDSEPLLAPSLFARVPIRFGLAGAALSYLVLFALLLLVPYEVERGLGFGPAVAGLDLLALPLAIGATSPFAGWVALRLGGPISSMGSGVVAGCGVVLVAIAGRSTALLVLGLALAGTGIGILNTVNNTGVMAALPTEQTGVGSGLLNTTRGLGTALGLAGGGALFVGLGGSSALESTVRSAFSVSAACLAALCVIAGLLAGRAAQRTS